MFDTNSFGFLWSGSGSVNAAHSGRILSVGDGVVTVSGLDSAKSGELVLFQNNSKGMVLNLERTVVKVVLFGSEREVGQGVTFSGQKALLVFARGLSCWGVPLTAWAML